MRQIFLLPFFLVSLFSSAQHQDKVDFLSCMALVSPDPNERTIQGTVAYTYHVLKRVDSLFLDAKNMEFSEVTINYEKVKYSYDGMRIVILKAFQKGNKDTLRLTYKTTPKQTVYFCWLSYVICLQVLRIFRCCNTKVLVT